MEQFEHLNAVGQISEVIAEHKEELEEKVQYIGAHAAIAEELYYARNED